MSLAIWAVAAAVLAAAVTNILKGPTMADFTRLNAALDSIATEIAALAEAIRNPATDNNDQTQVDDLAGRAEAAAAALQGLKVEEDAEDTGPTPPTE